METAQDAFRRMLQGRVAPGFRTLGLRGSGSNYVLPDDSYWMGIGLQRSRWSNAERVLFTMNMNFVSRKEWDELRRNWFGKLPDRPSPTTAYPVGLSWRIGAVLEEGETWWAVRGDEPLDQLADEIIFIVSDGGLPWLRRHREDPEFYKRADGSDFRRLTTKLGGFPEDLLF